MEDQKVQFQEYHVPRSSLEEKSKLIEWVKSYSGGLIKTEKQAIYVLLAFIVIGIIISIFIFFSVGSSDLKKIIPKTPYVDPPKPWAK